jgi:hypothetical protein
MIAGRGQRARSDLRLSLTLPVISQHGTEWVICALA